MNTTFEKYPPGWYANYASRPTNDVEIIECDPTCSKCYQPVREIDRDAYGWRRWGHVSDNPDCGTYVSLSTTCEYCGTNDPQHVTFSFGSYSDDVRCSRCGGYRGFPIGD